VALIALSVALFALRTQTQEDLEHARRTATQSAEEHAEKLADNNATATEVKVAVIATQSALEGDLATQNAAFFAQQGVLSDVKSTATQSADEYATRSVQIDATATRAQRDSSATQSALEGEVATQNAAFTAQQGVLSDVKSTATQSAVAWSTAAARSANQQATIQAQTAHIETLEAPLVLRDEPVAQVAVGNLFVREDFDDDSQWPVGPIGDGDRIEIREGQYWLTTQSYVEAYNLPVVNDAYLEAEVYLDDCPPDGFFAVSARDTSRPADVIGYYFLVRCDLGTWAIAVYRGQTGWENLAFNAFTPADDDPTKPHVIGVWLKEDTLKLYLDGIELGSATDETFDSGLVGLYAEASSKEVTLKVESLRVWQLP
jgi:hypothetical protein